MGRPPDPCIYPLPDDLSADALRRLAGLSGSAASRFRRIGAIPVTVADRYAIALGRHIDELWPEMAWIDQWLFEKEERNRRWVKQWMRRHGIAVRHAEE